MKLDLYAFVSIEHRQPKFQVSNCLLLLNFNIIVECRFFLFVFSFRKVRLFLLLLLLYINGMYFAYVVICKWMSSPNALKHVYSFIQHILKYHIYLSNGYQFSKKFMCRVAWKRKKVSERETKIEMLFFETLGTYKHVIFSLTHSVVVLSAQRSTPSSIYSVNRVSLLYIFSLLTTNKKRTMLNIHCSLC